MSRKPATSRPTLAQLRSRLGLWLLVAAVSYLAALAGRTLAGPSFPTALAIGCGVVAQVVAVAQAVGLQRRLSGVGSPVTPPQVLAASLILLILGPVGLLPPFGVWVHGGRFQAEAETATRRSRKRSG